MIDRPPEAILKKNSVNQRHQNYVQEIFSKYCLAFATQNIWGHSPEILCQAFYACKKYLQIKILFLAKSIKNLA